MANTYDTTMYPIGSRNPKVLYNDASNLDDLMLGPSNSYPDRFGRLRQSWTGIERLTAEYLQNMGFEASHLTYVDGSPLTVLRPTQLIDRSGSVYKVKAPATFPVTLSGNFATDEPRLVDVGDDSLRTTLAGGAGSAIVGNLFNAPGSVLRTVADHLNETINVKDFGARGDGVTDDWAAIDAARVYAASSASTFPYRMPEIYFPDGVYMISKSVWFTEAHHLRAYNARIVAMAGFVGVTVPLAAGGTELMPQMFVFLKGAKGAVGEPVRKKASILGITLDCDDKTSGNLYIERMPYTVFDLDCQFSSGDGVTFGPWMWGINGTIQVENFTGNALRFLPNAACNGVGLFVIIWGQFKEGNAGFLFDANAECNGFSIRGFVEKIKYGALINEGNGSIGFEQVDFEQCRFQVIRASGAMTGGVRIGPIKVNGGFAHSIESTKFFAQGARMEISGVKMFVGSADFETGTGGVIHAGDNEYANSTPGIVAGSNVVIETTDSDQVVVDNYLNAKSAAASSQYSMRLHQYRDSPFLQSAGFDFRSTYAGGANLTYSASSTWYVTRLDFGVTPGAPAVVAGLRLSTDGNVTSFAPVTHNNLFCGVAGAGWAGGSTVVAFTVTSDIRAKTEVRELKEAEIRVGMKLAPMIKAFKLKSHASESGAQAKIQIGVIAQEVCAVFAAEGLDALEYEAVHHSTWEAKPAELDKDGVELVPARAAGDMYSVNYEQLLALALRGLYETFNKAI